MTTRTSQISQSQSLHLHVSMVEKQAPENLMQLGTDALRVQGKKVTNIYVGQTESTPFSVAVEGVEVKTDLLVELSGEVEHRPRLCAVEIERR